MKSQLELDQVDYNKYILSRNNLKSPDVGMIPKNLKIKNVEMEVCYYISILDFCIINVFCFRYSLAKSPDPWLNCLYIHLSAVS